MIRTDKWKPSPDYSDRKIYDGQRTAHAVFEDLEMHLTSIGYLPDEYFLFDDSCWGNGREFPSDGWLTNQVDYGASEGIYLDIALEYQKNGERTWEHFATGKTLGETSEDLDRMNLISSAVTKAFHEDGVHSRYIVVGGTPAPEGVVISLNTEERRVVADSLAWHRESLASDDPDA
ncbi:MAG: ankyrin repeat domain-containing protein, partial [Clostridiales Family XIII bacterium]|nr:ankyrin repeat domain-containing protein [Clostridiales Family XIII bacterium]